MPPFLHNHDISHVEFGLREYSIVRTNFTSPCRRLQKHTLSYPSGTCDDDWLSRNLWPCVQPQCDVILGPMDKAEKDIMAVDDTMDLRQSYPIDLGMRWCPKCGSCNRVLSQVSTVSFDANVHRNYIPRTPFNLSEAYEWVEDCRHSSNASDASDRSGEEWTEIRNSRIAAGWSPRSVDAWGRRQRENTLPEEETPRGSNRKWQTMSTDIP